MFSSQDEKTKKKKKKILEHYQTLLTATLEAISGEATNTLTHEGSLCVGARGMYVTRQRCDSAR